MSIVRISCGMPSKKGVSGAARADEEDVSRDNFLKHNRKNCATLEININQKTRYYLRSTRKKKKRYSR